MASSSESTPATSKRRRWPWLGAALIALAVVVWAAWREWLSTPAGPADPRLTFQTPFRNVRPHVKYVGDENCVWCHGDIGARYAAHSMGQSLAPIAEASAVEKIDQVARFEAQGFEYLVERTPDGFKHHERLRDAKGGELLHAAFDVAYAVGSGTRGRSYLIRRGDQLFQSPISWYSGTSQWDIAPGYEKQNRHFERAIPPRCVFCHANQTAPVPGTSNRYEPPLFRGHAIGCERCHGPGQLHVARQESGESYAGADDTIVNPARLNGDLRNDVCAQCHLQGEDRVLRRGRGQYDYRPGLPLTLFEVVFVRHPDLVDYRKSVGQFEQVAVSACSKKTEGGLSCIACHDPHFKPSRAEAPAYFRGRCQKCHGGERVDCSVALGEREKQNENSCITCHMPRGDSSNIVHTSVTDHRIPRLPPDDAPVAPRKLLPWELPVVPFHAERLADDPELDRALGVALAGLSEKHQNKMPALLAHKRLHQALERHPDDVAAREAFGVSLLWQGRHDEAAAALAAALERQPRRESALFQAAVCAALSGADNEQALLNRLVDVNPYHFFAWQRLTDIHAARQEWPAVRDAAEKALDLNPSALEPRKALIQALVRARDLEQARRQVAIYEALGAKDAAAVRALVTDSKKK